jgi:hypothetical protein
MYLTLLETENYLNCEICALLGYYAASSGKPIPAFRDNLSVPNSRVKNSKKKLYLKTQSVPRSKHTPSQLHKPVS